MDLGEVLALVTLNAVIDSILGLVIGLWLVARAAGKRALRGWTAWLDSKDAEPYLDKMANRVEARMEPRLTAFEDRLNQPIQLDLEPVVTSVTNNVLPRVVEEINRVRAFIDGKIGFMRKVGKQTGEAVAEVVGEEAAVQAAGGDAVQAEIMGEMDGLLEDSEWVKEHKLAAFGLRILKGQAGGGKGITLQRGGSTAQAGKLRRRR